ncbi:Sec-independent protein translocase subunit TatA [Nocardia aurantia]|uniref:Sec-independent protein translocase protein TatA n=1 Tax=Nocardia aurantia TaxID=2585199 RepID=A0A7K0DQC8_9NOCA|nr:Sec-independent protein translocase subunit TatA [Nocardia aurantia]MQY27975.1 Sec-independent protein translocase protein TatA [Nocardia aurantia]
MGSLSATHWLLIALVFVLLFGAKRLPDAARGLGRSLRIFKSEMQEMQTEGGKSAPSAGTSTASTPQAPAELPSAQPTANPAAQANPDLHKA